MATLQEKLAEIIEKNLRDGHADLETLPDGNVCGYVVSSEFENKDYRERRLRIREVLDRCVESGRLQKDELLHVSTLLTYTPDEWSYQVENSSEEA